jgi:hypothetical protein
MLPFRQNPISGDVVPVVGVIIIRITESPA